MWAVSVVGLSPGPQERGRAPAASRIRRRGWLTASTLAVLAALALAAPDSAASPLPATALRAPSLLHVGASGRHVVAVARFTVGSHPLELEVSRSSRLGHDGFAPSAVVLRQSIGVTPAPPGTLTIVGRTRLPAGRYWVAVSSSLLQLGITDCVPIKLRGECSFPAWSNVLPLRIR